MNTQEIERLHNEGYTQYEIARLTGYSQPAVSIALQGMGYNGKDRMKNYERIENAEIRQFCKEHSLNVKKLTVITGLSRNKVNQFIEDSLNTTVTITEIKRLLRAMGKTFEEVFGDETNV